MKLLSSEYKNMKMKKALSVLFLILLLTALISVSAAEESYSPKIYLLEDETHTFTPPPGATLHSGNPRVIELAGNQATAKEAGTAIIYSEVDGQYNEFCEIVVFGDKLEVLVLDGINFSTVPYINETRRAPYANPEAMREFIQTNPLSSYDIVSFGVGPDDYNWMEPMRSAVWDGNESGTLIISPSGLSDVNKKYISNVPDYIDYRYGPEYLGVYDHLNKTFAEEFEKAERVEVVAQLLVKQALSKMIYKAESSSNLSVEDAKKVLEDPTSGPEDYIRETHKLKKELAENVRISKIIIDETDIQLKIGSQKELNAQVLTSMGIASGTDITWESDNVSVATVDAYGMVTAVGEGEATIFAKFGSKMPAECNVTVGKYINIFLVNNGSVYSDSVVLHNLSNKILFRAGQKTLLYNNLSQYDIIFDVGSIGPYNLNFDNGSIVINSSVSLSEAGFNNLLKNRSHVAIWGNRTDVPAGVYYRDDVPLQSDFATLLQDFNKDNTSQEKLEAFISNGEIEREALKVFIEKHSELNSEDYTPETWSIFEAEYNEAQTVLNDSNATPAEIAAMLYDVKESYRDLEYVNPGEVVSVTLSKAGGSQLRLNSTIKVKATVSGDSLKDKNVTWSSSDSSILSVNDSGVIKALSPGKATITATSTADLMKSASIEIEAIIPPQGIFLSTSKLDFIVGDGSAQLSAVLHPLTSSVGEIKWSSSDPSIATVDSNGLVTPNGDNKARRTIITAEVVFNENAYNSSSGKIQSKTHTFESQVNVNVKLPVEDRVRVLYVGESPLIGLESASEEMYYCGYFDYNFVNGYDAETMKISQELLEAAENFGQYDVVYFDMFGEYETIKTELEQANKAGTKFVSLETNGQPPQYFVSLSSQESQKDSDLYNYYKQLIVNNEISVASMLWGEKFLLQSAKEYAPKEKITFLENETSLKVLYIGSHASNFAATVKNFNAGVYGDVVEWTVLPYNEAEKKYEEFFSYTNASGGNLTEQETAQIAAINKHLSGNKDAYDIIICDGFSGVSQISKDPMSGRPVVTLSTHFDYLSEFKNVSNDSVIFILGKDGFWLPMNLPFANKEYSSDSTQLTFDLGDEDVKAANEFLFKFIQTYGTDRVKSWAYTDNSGAMGDAGYIHPVEGGSRVRFSNLDNYIAWATKNGYFDPGRPTVGIWMFSSDIGQGTDALIFALEKEGVNVIAGFETYDEIPKYYKWSDEAGHERQIDAAISIKNFGLNYWDYEEGIRQLEEMNIPVLKGFFATGSKDQMTNISDVNNMVDSVNGARMTLSPNRDGIFDFIYLGYMKSGSGPVGVQAQIDWMAERAAAWAFLNQKDNAEKDVAILYYNYPPGKADIGANYLNVMRSFSGTGSYPGILRSMNAPYEGLNGEELGNYNVDFTQIPLATPLKDGTGGYSFEYYESGNKDDWRDKVMTEDNIMYLMLSQGINVGSHAPGVLDGMVQEYIKFLGDGGKHEEWWGCQLLPVSMYKQWYDDTLISDELREELVDTWGEPWDLSEELPKDQSGMIWEDKGGYFGSPGERYFVFSAIRMGNVWILPQPDRALAGSQAINGSLSSTDYHGDMAPTHQYVAFYFWLNRGMTAGSEYDFIAQDWKPDAVIHFGTHGTQEWLPGTAIGMQQGIDWSPILIGRLPNIYPYIVANVGEGLTAEYRGDALIIDHLTPAMIRSGLYGEMADLDSEIQSFIKQASMGNTNTSLSYEYRLKIVNLIYESGVNEALDLSAYEKHIKGTVTDDKMKQVLLNTSIVSDEEFSNLLKNQVHNYLDSVMENALPYGMHVYGQSPDDNRTAYMVRAMWGNYGFEELIQSVYFEELPEGLTIPFEPVPDGNGGFYYNGKSDKDVQEFVTLYVQGENIQEALIDTLGEAPASELLKIELFIRGPAMYYEDSKLTGNDLKNRLKIDWRSCGVDDIMIEELCTDFVPKAVATDGNFNQTKFDDAFDKFVDDFVDHMVDENISPAEAVDKSLTTNFNINGYTTQTWINQPVIDYVVAYQRDSFASNLKDCGDSEMYALLNALSAGYIPPTTGNDPIQNPSILPTGRNFYGIDPNTYPTRAAWEVGQAMGEQMLVDYYEKHGEFPKMVSFTRFGVEFIRDEGALEACIYYLLGCEPSWSGNEYTGAGTFQGATPVTDKNDPMFTVTLSDGSQVKRPRVDITYTTAGMRDAFPSALRYIDKAIKAVNALENDPIENNIQKNTKAIKEALKKANPELSDEQIEKLALARTFAQELGTYEIGTGNLVSSSGSWNENSDQAKQDIVDLYLNKMGYIYNDEFWGDAKNEAMNQAVSEVLKELLSRADASMFASSSNLYDTLDNDDVYQYFGIMNMVSKHYGGKMPELYMADTSNVANYKPGDKLVSTMQEAIKKDLDSRYLNPEWIQGMLESGYSGSSMMSEFVENLFGWSVATDGELVSDKVWSQILETYIDSGILEGNDKYVYSYQSMTGRMIEAIRNGYWDASDAQQKQLMKAYVQSVLEAGVACCHHTCGNPALDSFIAGQMSVLGLTPEEQEKYWEIVKEATDRDKPSVKIPEKNSSGGGFGTATAADPGQVSQDGEEGDESADAAQSPGVGMDGTESGTPTTVSGIEMTVTQFSNSVRDFVQNPSFSSSSIIAIAFVILVVGAVFYGSRKRKL